MATAFDRIFDGKSPRLYSIAPGRVFLAELAGTLRASIGRIEGVHLAAAVIYLPTRRAVRALTQAFVDTAPDMRATLLPQISALGDVDEDEFIAFAGNAEDEIELPPAIAAMERRLTLAQLVAARDEAFFDGQKNWAGAIAAGDELGKLLESLYTEEIPSSRLKEIVPDEFADHWKRSLEFLSIVTAAWPKYLAERERSDPADRRVKLIDKQIERWKKAPPQTPVIIAGTTGSTPAVSRLMKCVMQLPYGCVVLPGLDLKSPQHVWDAIDEPHPQSGLKQLLNSLAIERGDIEEWPSTTKNRDQVIKRDNLLTVALRPADASDDWRNWSEEAKRDGAALAQSLDGLEIVEARDEDLEASAIALKFREVVENKHKTAMLVTPDRSLARRVSAKMRRWKIDVDDSAGVPFMHTNCGTFLRLVAEWLQDISAPVPLLAVLDHPLFGGGLYETDRKKAIKTFDALLRGQRPSRGIKGLAFKLNAETLQPPAKKLFDLISHIATLWPENGASFKERFEAHLSIAEMLAASEDETGATRLWRGDDGETGASMLSQLRENLNLIGNEAQNKYASIFTSLIATAVVRRKRSAHPRLFILGPLEARLQNADLVILGSLNEGVWPRDAAIDPFLSRPMRETLGLPSPERRIGLAAHDFMQLASSPAVMLTRATQGDGKPTKPSRWIVRLKNILIGADALHLADKTRRYERLVLMLDATEKAPPLSPPSPRPPVSARPKSFYVTRVETLLRDPYAVYARDVLRLRKLERHGELFDARYVGLLFHKVFEQFCAAGPAQDRTSRINQLKTLFSEYAPLGGMTEEHLAFWSTRIEEAVQWFADWDLERRKLGSPVIVESNGEFEIDIEGEVYSLSARADRIDLLKDGDAYIVDYKSGSLPTLEQIGSNFSPQLPLTGLIVEGGGFKELGAVPVHGFEYVRVLNRKGKNDNVEASGKDCAKLIAESRDGFIDLMKHFANPETSYPSQPRAQYSSRFGDYDHLARRRERIAQGDDDDAS